MCKFYKMLSLNKPNPKAESIERVFLALRHLLSSLLAFRNTETSVQRRATLCITAIMPLAS